MKSSRSSTADRARNVVGRLAEDYPDAHCALVHASALELLVATILSAQCTDVRVNLVTKALFKKYRGARAFAEADPAELERDVRSTGFFRNKARSIRGAARLLVEKHGGRVPDTMEDLLELPGVARKTANVVLGTWFRKPTGVVVDTHVRRISRRLGLTREEDPKKIERDLMAALPSEEWIDFSHRMISHGRKICGARRAKCEECSLASCCPSAGRIS
jgi:endonuclease III